MRVKFFTHSDLDGVMSNLLVARYYGMCGYEHSTERCDAGSIDDKINEYINSWEYKEDTMIFITDLCPSYEMLCKLDNLKNCVRVLDHHQTNSEAAGSRFKWVYIKEGDSATLHAFKFVLAESSKLEDTKIYDTIFKYKDIVKITDLWDTKSRISEEYVKNKELIDDTVTLMNCLGINGIRGRFWTFPSMIFSEIEWAKIETLKRIKNSVIRYANVIECSLVHNEEKIKYGVYFGSLYRSELAEFCMDRDRDMRFMFIVDMSGTKVSLRGSSYWDYDLTFIAKQFDKNGGGHPSACGFGFEMSGYKETLDRIMGAGFSMM